MKTKLLILATIFITTLGYAQTTYVPNDNFENYLETHDANGISVPVGDPTSMGNGISNDDYVTTANINTVINLNVVNQNIMDLTGIEDFQSLQGLNCSNNQLTNLDVSSNLGLTSLICNSNQLTNLDVTSNVALLTLQCGVNQLTSLDISSNVALTYFVCSYNQLTNLNVSSNVDLTYLNSNNNPLTNLDVSSNVALTTLLCAANQLSNLDVSSNVALTYLLCAANSISSLDVSSNLALTKLYCHSNQLTSLDVSQNVNLVELHCENNQLTSLNVKNGNNINFNQYNSTSNPNLRCIVVDDAAWSTINWLDVDSTSTFVNNQAECTTLSTEEFIQNAVSIYPNPATNQVTVSIEKEAEYALVSINGQLLQAGVLVIGENSLNIETLSNGLYFLNIKNTNGMLSKKIIKH